MMHRTKTWIVLYALGIALLVLSLCQSEERKPGGPPRPPAPSTRGAVIPPQGMNTANLSISPGRLELPSEAPPQ